jgi:hypothetical protein
MDLLSAKAAQLGAEEFAELVNADFLALHSEALAKCANSPNSEHERIICECFLGRVDVLAKRFWFVVGGEGVARFIEILRRQVEEQNGPLVSANAGLISSQVMSRLELMTESRILYYESQARQARVMAERKRGCRLMGLDADQAAVFLKAIQTELTRLEGAGWTQLAIGKQLRPGREDSGRRLVSALRQGKIRKADGKGSRLSTSSFPVILETLKELSTPPR